MIKTDKIGSLTRLIATEGYIHKLGTDTYVKSIVILSSESIEAYEEVMEIPPYTKAEYDAKVAEMVRSRYSDSEEFAIQRKVINSLLSPMTLSADSAEKVMTEYADYNNYVQQCKADAPAAILEDKAREEEAATNDNSE